MSSISPTRNITVAAIEHAPRLGVAGEQRVEPVHQARHAERGDEADEHRDAARRRGVAMVCTVRSFGRYTQPTRLANRLTSGVTAKVTTAATAPTSR